MPRLEETAQALWMGAKEEEGEDDEDEEENDE